MLEIACRSGIVTRKISLAVGERGRVFATDLARKMVDTTDALALPNVRTANECGSLGDKLAVAGYCIEQPKRQRDYAFAAVLGPLTGNDECVLLDPIPSDRGGLADSLAEQDEQLDDRAIRVSDLRRPEPNPSQLQFGQNSVPTSLRFFLETCAGR